MSGVLDSGRLNLREEAAKHSDIGYCAKCFRAVERERIHAETTSSAENHYLYGSHRVHTHLCFKAQ